MAICAQQRLTSGWDRLPVAAAGSRRDEPEAGLALVLSDRSGQAGGF